MAPAEHPPPAPGGPRLLVFVKAPRPGLVKTRLVPSLGAAGAASAYAALVDALLTRLDTLRDVELWFTPPDRLDAIRPWLRPGWGAQAQREGDLGDRLHHAFATAFAQGATRVVVIGSDCPEVAVPDIRTAWTRLETADVVLGPAADGGYWLIGLRRPQPELFRDIPWSTSDVLARTLERVAGQELRPALLRELRDVDTIEDWLAFRRPS